MEDFIVQQQWNCGSNRIKRRRYINHLEMDHKFWHHGNTEASFSFITSVSTTVKHFNVFHIACVHYLIMSTLEQADCKDSFVADSIDPGLLVSYAIVGF
jgi:hypothetical protein